MAEHLLVKKYINHFGLDLKSSDLTRLGQFASGITNAQYRKSGTIEKRAGFHAHAPDEGGHGLFTYSRIDPDTNKQDSELLSISDRLHKSNVSVLSVTYSGGDPTSFISIFFNVSSSEYVCQIQEGSTIVLNEGLGKGFDEASIKTIDDLKIDIDALTGFTATVTGVTTTPAAFLKTVRNFDLTSSSFSDEARNWEEVNKTVTAPFIGSETNKNDSDFENVSSVQINNVMFFSNGYDEVQKYDGQTVYRAGVPSVASLTVAKVGAGSITGTKYIHKAQYIQIDAVGNVTEGNVFTSTSGEIDVTAEDFDVTVANILASSGFNTNAAIVDGAQVTVTTITVDDGSGGLHTLKAGDSAYFFDAVTSDFVTRNITSITSTSITIAGAAVTVADSAVVSNNLRIALYRSKSSGSTPTTFFLIDEIPNDSFSATQVFRDDNIDSALGAQLIEPLTDRSPPTKGRYISSFRNQAIIGGNLENQNTIFFSDVLSPEFFPFGNQFDVNSVAGDVISGIAPNNEVFIIFKKKSIHLLSGDISNGNIRVDQVSNDIGCVAHASIDEVRGSLFFLSDLGPRKITGGQLPQPIGAAQNNSTVSRIDPVFEEKGLSDEEKLQLKRSVAINNRLDEKYILFIPAESTTSGDVHPNSNSRIFTHDYSRDAWLEWDTLNMAGGITEFDDGLFWTERRFSSFNVAVDHVLLRKMNLNDSFDFQDNTDPINFEYKAQWEFLGEASLLKRFLVLRVFILEDNPNNEVMLDVETEINFIEDAVQSSFTLLFEGVGYGVGPYGVSGYGDPVEPTLKHKLAIGRNRALRVIFKNSEDQQNVLLTGWELEMALPFRPEFKR